MSNDSQIFRALFARGKKTKISEVYPTFGTEVKQLASKMLAPGGMTAPLGTRV